MFGMVSRIFVKKLLYIVNVIDKPYDPNHAELMDINKFPFKGYSWE